MSATGGDDVEARRHRLETDVTAGLHRDVVIVDAGHDQDVAQRRQLRGSLIGHRFHAHDSAASLESVNDD